MPCASDTTSIEHWALNTYRESPLVWPHCLGKHVSPVACRVAAENCFGHLTDHVDFRLTDDTHFGAVNVEN